MKKLICHVVDKSTDTHLGIDQYIAEKSGWTPSMGNMGMNPHKVASFRGLYDQNALEIGGEPLIPDNVVNPTKEQLDEAFKKLLNFRKGIGLKHAVALANNKKHLDRAYDRLRHAFSLKQRKQRISLVSTLFSEEVDRLMSNTRGVDRQSVVNGFRTVSGDVYGGVQSIFSAVYNHLMEERQNYYESIFLYEERWKGIQQRLKDAWAPNSTNPEDRFILDFNDAPTNAEEYKSMCEVRFREYSNLIDNWEAILPFVMKDLVHKEGVKLSIKKEFLDIASSDNYGDNDIADKWDMSESVRDGWQRNNDMESAAGSIGQQVRRVLATIYEVESYPEYEYKNGKRIFKGIKTRRIVDEMGNVVYKDPIQVHQFLSEYLKGIQDSHDLMKRLIKPGTDEATIPWLQPLVDLLTGYGLPEGEKMKLFQLRTQLFVDFKKNFQPYSVMYEDKKKSVGMLKSIKTKILNLPKNLLKDRYNNTISSKGRFPVNVKVWGFPTVFEEGAEGGKVNWERLAELRQLVLKWTQEKEEKETDTSKSKVFDNLKTYGVSIAPLLDTRHDAMIEIDGKMERITYRMKRNFLLEVFTSLGYDVTIDTIDSILNSTDIGTVRKQLEDLFNPDNKLTGFIYVLGGNNRRNFKKLTQNITAEDRKKALEDLNRELPSFRRLYNITTGKTPDGASIQPVREHSEKLLSIINRHQEGKRLESRARYMGNTMYSFVNPSYLGDRLEEIESYVKDNDHDALLKYLKHEYLQSPFFVDDEYLDTDGKSGKILNTWLAELVEACKNQRVNLADSVAAIFNYERDLGSTDKKFEDFTSREHAQDMLIHFFADEQQQKGYGGKGNRDINKRLSALYPVFILGDAGVSKYIRAPRITSQKWLDIHEKELVKDFTNKNKINKIVSVFDEEAKDKVVDAFWNIYIQEKRRMAIDDAMTFDLYANGKVVKHAKGEFSILTFLNPTSQEYISDYYIPDGSVQGETDMTSNETEVKKIIRKYLENATLNDLKRVDGNLIPSFKHRLSELGLLETVKDNRGKEHYRFLNSIVTPENIDAKLTEFYWNVKLATAEQLQLMTLDPYFYYNTKDLQKRYKEIHAPGNVLDVLARDSKGNLYSPDGIEKVAYFKDIEVNAELSNPEFMESILRIFAKPGVDVDAAIAEGVLIPKKGSEENARQKRLIDILGKDMFKKIYFPYMANTLTDGQGYRTLTSYRKVMGMAGKWTEEMENAYDTILEIRKRHEDGSDLNENELKTLANFTLILQPIKPYMFTHEKIHVKIQKTDSKGNKLVDAQGNPIMIDAIHYIPVQHKYAEALIIPELLPKGSKLRDLGIWMEKKGVDLVGSDKIAKVGCFGQTDLSAVKNTGDLFTAMESAYIHELPYRDYRIQTNVPEHINASQLFGTQVRKLIMAGLDMTSDYSDYLDAKEINLSTDGKTNLSCSLKGRNLLALYNSLICANIFDSYEKFQQNIEDIDSVAEMLQQATIGLTREAMDNLFSYVVTGNEEALKDFMIPLFEGGLAHDTASLLLSTFKKIVNKQQISGGSAVQVSAFGITGYEEEKDGETLRFVQDPDNKGNILYAEIEMPFNRTYTIDVIGKDGKKTKQSVSLSYDKYCNNDGTLIPTGKALTKGTKEWKKYQSYTYKEVDGKLVPCNYNDPEAQVYKPLIEEDYPDILSILAYRIPSENDYSMINCQIKRFSSKMAGGTLKVPAQGTTIAGFDFDIDKLYFMLREYHKSFNDSSYVESKFSDDDKYSIWTDIFRQYGDLKEAVANAREDAEAKDPSLVITRTLPNGKVRIKHLTALNSYFDEVNGEAIIGKSKYEVFAETAKKLGYTPTVNLVEGEKTEVLDTYDFTKTPEDNTRANRNNLLITLIQARLMDPNTTKQRYTPGGFEDAKKAARLMRELRFGDLSSVYDGNQVNMEALRNRQGKMEDPEPNYSATDPYTILIYNQQNQVAGKLIGIFANQNTHNAFVSCMDVFKLKKPIDFCGHSNMQDLLHKDPEEAYKINLNIAQFLAASVDAVKDPVLNFMNLNTITADPAALLARLGYNMEEIGLFLSQPVIVDICQESFNSGKNIKTVISDMQSKLRGYLTGVKLDQKVPITTNSLASSIIEERLNVERGEKHDKFLSKDAINQYAVLEMFSEILKASQDVSDFVLNTKFTASNAVGSTFGSLYSQQMRVDKYLEKFKEDAKGNTNISYEVKVSITADGTGLMSKPIDNMEKLTSMSKKEYLHYVRFNPFAYEQAMYDSNRKAVKLLAKYFPYETPLYKDVRRTMQDLARYGTLKDEEIDDIHSNILVALLARQINSDFHGEGLHRKKDSDGIYKKMDVTNRQYYREDFGGELESILMNNPELRELAVFKYLTTESTEVTTGKKDPKYGLDIKKEVWSISMQDVGGMDSDVKDEIRESWAYLMEVDDNGNFKNPQYAELGKDLFMYCYYQMGFDFSPISFMHLAPTAVKDNIIVERENSLPINTFNEGDINWRDENSNDVLVWSATVPGSFERLEADFDLDRSLIGELQGNTFRLHDTLNHDSIVYLVNEAVSHPELRFKIDMELSQEDFNLFTRESLGRDVPSNIYFSKGTFERVSQESKEAVSYGRNRTYRQFLREIINGDLNLNIGDFCKQWILNHLDNAKFVFDLNKGNKTVKEELGKQAKNSLKIDSNSITFDVSNLIANDKIDADALSSFVKIKVANNAIVEARWCPCILYNGSYYMAESDPDGNIGLNRSSVMIYHKVTPLGSSQTLRYDNGKEMKPSMRYQAYYGETDEDLSHAEFVRTTPVISQASEDEEGSEEGSDSETPKGNKDASAIVEAFNAIKQYAEDNNLGASKDWESILNTLINTDLTEEVKDSDDPLNDDVWDFVEDNMRGREWRKCSDEVKKALVSAVFEYNKNPKYLPEESPVGPEDPTGDTGSFALPGTVRNILIDTFLKDYISGLEKRDGIPPRREDIEGIKRAIAAQTDKDLMEGIEALKKSYDKEGVATLDSNGNPIAMC